MIVFAGFDGARRNDVWALSLSGVPTWVPLLPSGVAPSTRSNHSAIYDPVRDRMLVFGGSDGSLRDDLWALSLAGAPEWSQLAPSGSPPAARGGHAATYDPVRDQMVVFGGDDATFLDDSWALSLAGVPTWTPLTPTGSVPPGRRYHSAVYDPWGNRVVVFGGWNGYYRDDAAALTWGDPVKPAAACAGDQTTGPGTSIDAAYALHHALSGDRALEWTLVSTRGWPGFPARGRLVVGAFAAETVTVQIAVPDTAAPGLNLMRFTVALAGAAGNDSACEHRVDVTGQVGVEAHASGELALEGARPHPVAGELTVSMTLPAAGRAKLELFDVEGRRVGARLEADVGPGRHRVAIPSTEGLPSGVYVVRLTFGRASLQRRVVVVH
jgi:hypothetical protein